MGRTPALKGINYVVGLGKFNRNAYPCRKIWNHNDTKVQLGLNLPILSLFQCLLRHTSVSHAKGRATIERLHPCTFIVL